MVLIALVTSLVVRLVVVPIRGAAETSRKIAAGRLDERIPVRGQDDLATLARELQRDGRGGAAVRSPSSPSSPACSSGSCPTCRTSSAPRSPRSGSPATCSTTPGTRSNRRSVGPPNSCTPRWSASSCSSPTCSRSRGTTPRRCSSTPHPSSRASLAADIVDEFRPLAERAGVELQLATPGGHTTMRLDAKRVRRILRNLVGNAIEHGERKARSQVVVDSDARTVAIAVRDQGVGMPPEDAARVFDRFWRADPEPEAHHRRHRARPRDQPRRREAPRRAHRRVVPTGRGIDLRAHPAPQRAGHHRHLGHPAARARRVVRRPPRRARGVLMRHRIRHVLAVALAAVSLFAVTACAAIPTDGAVRTGQTIKDESLSGVDFRPDKPITGSDQDGDPPRVHRRRHRCPGQLRDRPASSWPPTSPSGGTRGRASRSGTAAAPSSARTTASSPTR